MKVFTKLWLVLLAFTMSAGVLVAQSLTKELPPPSIKYADYMADLGDGVNTDEPCVDGLYTTGCTWGDGITYWDLADVNVPLIECDGDPNEWYHDFTAVSHSLEAGMDYTLTIQVGYSDNFVDLWIDFNDDLFYDETELVVDDFECLELGVDYTTTISIPSDAAAGDHLMRWRTEWLNPVTGSCDIQTYGNMADVMVNIAGGSSDEYCIDGLYSTGCSFGDGTIYWDMADLNVPAIACDGATYEWYHDMTDMTMNVEAGMDYTLTVQDGYGNQYLDVWVDWNNDFYMDDAELLVNDWYLELEATDYTMTVTIPSDAPEGDFVLRSRSSYFDPLTESCEAVSYGNMLDFTISTTGGVTELEPPVNLTADVDVNDVYLQWQAPGESPLSEIAYDDGTNEQSWWISGNPTDPNDMMALRLTMPEDGTLNEVAFFTRTGTTGPFNFADVMVCPDDGAGLPDLDNPYESFGEQIIENTEMEWLMFTLTTPLDMTSGDDFWIVANWEGGNTDGPFIGGDNSTVPTEDRNYWSNVPGTWNLFTTSNFMMRGYYTPAGKSYDGSGVKFITHKNEKGLTIPVSTVINPLPTDGIASWKAPTFFTGGTKALTGYNVYRDGAYLDYTDMEYYDDMGLADGTYEYYVTAVYDEGESDPSNTVTVEIAGLTEYCLDGLYSTGCDFGDGFAYWDLADVNVPTIGCDGPIYPWYHDMTDMVHHLTPGMDYVLTVQAGYGGEFVDIWVDWNMDYYMDDTELLVNDWELSEVGIDYSTTISIPSDAPAGEFMLRARSNWLSGLVESCEAVSYGMLLEFTVATGAADYCEDFDDLTAGGYVAGQLGSPWNTWGNDPGGADDAFVSDTYSNSPSNSFVVNDGAIDLIYEFGAEPIDAGTATYSHYNYIPTGYSGYFNVQSDPTPGVDWVLDFFFDDGGTGSIDVEGVNALDFDYAQDTWIMVQVDFDLDNDMGEIFFDGVSVLEFAYAGTIGGIDYYGLDQGGAPGAYYDDVCFMAEEPGNDLNPPLNLEADVNLYTVELTWDAPEGTGSDLTEIAYDDGTGEQSWWISGNPTSPDDMMAVRLTMPEDGTLQEVAFFTRTGTTGPFNFADVWVCPDDGAGLPDLSNPYESFGEQVIENTVMEWLMFTLTTPLDMTSGEDFWIVANWVGGNTDGPFIGGDNTAPPAEDRNYWSNVPGVWNLFTTSNFMMRGYYSPAGKSYAGGGLNIITHRNDKDLVVPVSSLTNPVLSDGTQSWKAPTIITGAKELTGYNVYRDGAMIDNTSSESYDDMGLAPGTYEYYVTAVYDEGESDPSNTVSAEVIEIITVECEDFDELTAGDYVALQLGGFWTTWGGNPGGADDAFVTDANSNSPDNSFVIDDAAMDVVFQFGAEPITSGVYSYSHYMYVPSGTSGYFNVQSEPTPGVAWVIDLYFDDGGTGTFAGQSTDPFVYTQDTWFMVEIMFDMNVGLAWVYFDGEMILEFTNTLTIGGIDYYGSTSGGAPGAYYDDVCFHDLTPEPCDNFDDLTAGGYVAEQLGGLWNTWGNDPGGADDAMVSDAESYSPDNSFVVDNAAVDLIREFGSGPISSGAWLYEHFMYVPSGFSGYFNVQSDPTPGVAWVIELYFDDGGTGSFIVDGTTTEFEYTQDTWFWVGINFDLFESLAEVWFDDDIVHAFATTTTIGGIDYYGSTSGGAPGAYYDDVCFGEGYLIDRVIDNVATTLQVFPNPATYEVNIQSDYTIHNVIVYNFAGQMVANEQVGNTTHSVDVSDFNPGVYIFQIDTEEGRITERIVVK